MSSTDKYQVGVAPIDQVIADLQRRVLALETGPRLQSASIDVGALQVRDATGDVRVIIGLLPDGSYGINVKETGQNNFHQVPYVYSATVPTGEVCSSNVYGDLATVGPTVTVPVRSSGRILIIASAQVQSVAGGFLATSTADGRFDVAFSGTNTRVPNEVVDPLVGIFDLSMVVTAGTDAFAQANSIASQSTFEGLNPGDTTITMKYARSSAATQDPTFFRRTLTVIAL